MNPLPATAHYRKTERGWAWGQKGDLWPARTGRACPQALPRGVCCRNAAKRAGPRDICRRSRDGLRRGWRLRSEAEPACPWRRLTAPQQPSNLRQAFRDFSRRSRTQDSAGWSSFADTGRKPLPTSSIRTRVFLCFSRSGVSAEMSIRSASAGTSTTHGFSEGSSS